MFDLRNFREDVLMLTQNELASLIDERQDKISRLEKNPDNIGLDILIKIADKTGTTLDELVQYKKKLPEALRIDDTWNSVTVIKNKIDDYVTKVKESKTRDKKELEKAKEIKEFTDRFLKKPKIALVGLSDTGKSTLINSMLGEEKIPAAWTPTTAITIYIKHRDDRPSYIEDDVWFLKPQGENGCGWDSNRLYDEDYTKGYLSRKGHIQDLQEFAVRRDIDSRTIGAAVVFIDSAILKVCELIDLPGYNTGDRELDIRLTEQVRDYADIMIYMSLANGFMRGNDIEYLKSDLNYLPIFENEEKKNRPLSNLYLIASQAHVVQKGNPEALKKILDEGAKRLYSQIPQELWKQRCKITGVDYTQESLRGCFYTYSKDIESLRDSFELDFTHLIESHSSLLIKQYKVALQEFCQINRLKIRQEIKENLEISHKRDAFISLSESLTGHLPQIRNLAPGYGHDVVKQTQTICDTAVGDLKKAYHELLSTESVINIIDEEAYKNVKGDLEKLVSIINSKLQENIHYILEARSLEYINEIDQFIINYDQLVNGISASQSSGVNYKYSAKSAFVKGLAECQSIGANAAWKSRLKDIDIDANVSEDVDVLSAMLYTVPGAGGQSHSVAGGLAFALGLTGIVGLGIGLAMLAITSGMSTFGEGWKKSVAKKIVAAYSSENVLDRYIDVIEEFWKTTDRAFIASADYIDKDLGNELAKLSTKVNELDKQELEQFIIMDEKLIELYNEIEEDLLYLLVMNKG